MSSWLSKNNYFNSGVPWETCYKGEIWNLNSTFFKVDFYNCSYRCLEHHSIHPIGKTNLQLPTMIENLQWNLFKVWSQHHLETSYLASKG
jgi:hypothetical protein